MKLRRHDKICKQQQIITEVLCDASYPEQFQIHLNPNYSLQNVITAYRWCEIVPCFKAGARCLSSVSLYRVVVSFHYATYYLSFNFSIFSFMGKSSS